MEKQTCDNDDTHIKTVAFPNIFYNTNMTLETSQENPQALKLRSFTMSIPTQTEYL